MEWALSMGMIRSKESEFGRASSGPTSLRHRATGSKRIRQTRARPGRLTGCRTSREFADRGDRQCPVRTRALDAGSLGDFSDALSLGEVAQGNEQNAGLDFIFQCSFEVLGGK